MNQATPTGSDELLAHLKSNWNSVLDNLLAKNRIAWLAYFDARLASISNSTLTLNFSDSEKFVGGHDFLAARNPEHKRALQQAIHEELALELEIIEEQSP